MQSGHAIADFIIDNPLTAWKWNKNSNVMVSLSTPDHSSLKSLAEQLQEKKIPFTLFYEPDISEHTAIATTDAAAHLLKGYPLALKNKRLCSSMVRAETSKLSDAGSSPDTTTKNIKLCG